MKKSKKPIKPKKLTKKKLASLARTAKRKSLQEWSITVRTRDGNQCCVCGKTDHIQAHHLIPKERFPEFMLDVNNGISLCPGCHKYGAFSFHRHPIWSVLWLKENKLNQYEWVAERSHEKEP